MVLWLGTWNIYQ